MCGSGAGQVDPGHLVDGKKRFRHGVGVRDKVHEILIGCDKLAHGMVGAAVALRQRRARVVRPAAHRRNGRQPRGLGPPGGWVAAQYARQ